MSLLRRFRRSSAGRGRPQASPLVDAVVARATRALDAVPVADRPQVYAVSLFVYDWEDDPAQPTVTIGCNTEAQVTASTPEAADEAEARWNYAFWSQEQLDVVGGPDDLAVARVVRDGFDRAGLFLDPYDHTDAAYATGEAMTVLFVDACVEAARRLHDAGVITATFGRPIPVLVHELEYDEVIAEQNRRANPPGLVDAFCAWVEAS